MIAKVLVKLPFTICLPLEGKYRLKEWDNEVYKIRIYPPSPTEEGFKDQFAQKYIIEGHEAVLSEILPIEFRKQEFDRTDPHNEYILRPSADNEIIDIQSNSDDVIVRDPARGDPAPDLILCVVNDFLTKLRYVTRSPNIHTLSRSQFVWVLTYLNDDGSNLEYDERYIRQIASFTPSFIGTALTPDVWDQIFSLNVGYEIPPWEDLLLDARAQYPNIGPSIVLASTALEVFISYILDRLAICETIIPRELWEWINNRGDWRKEPSIEEQYNILLKVLSGHSLKEEPELWKAFKEIRHARNSFVHGGIAMIGDQPVTTATLGKLVISAEAIITRVRDWVPSEIQWDRYECNSVLESLIPLKKFL